MPKYGFSSSNYTSHSDSYLKYIYNVGIRSIDTAPSYGNAENLIDIENKIKYNESIIRHLFISVKEHDGEDSQLLIDSRNKKSESEDEESIVKNEVKEKPAEDDEKKNEEEIVSKEESIEDISSDSIEEDSKDE